MKKKISIAVVILMIGLLGSITNYIYISPIPSLFSAALLFILLTRKRVNRVVFSTLLFFLVSCLSTLIYYSESFYNFTFYRYDGNFIVSYLPLLVFPLFSAQFKIEKVVTVFLVFVVLFYACLFAFSEMAFYRTTFHGLFLSTNAAGGFLSIISSFVLVKFLKKKSPFYFIILIAVIFLLWSTRSRGSILGFILGAVMLFLWKNNKRWVIKIGIGLIILTQTIILMNTYPIYKKNTHLRQSVQEYIFKEEGETNGKRMNIYLRAYENWPRGLNCFLESPILGTGFGSANDTPLIFKKGFPWIFKLNKQPDKTFSSGHAHHSYLHILGEQGLLGFFIFIFMLWNIYTFIKNNSQSPFIQEGLLLSFFSLIIMSFTEHRFTTPSNALPFTLIFCLYYIYVNGLKNKRSESI